MQGLNCLAGRAKTLSAFKLAILYNARRQYVKKVR